MRKLYALVSLLSAMAQVQAQTIEGFWQDVAGRTTFKKDVSPSAVYGSWHPRELDATYPQAKLIRRTEGGFELTDLNYDEKDYSVRVLYADPLRIVFARQANWSTCRTEHDCRLAGDGLACAMKTVCRDAGKEFVDWEGDERYVRRAHCARDGGVQAQGFPVKCR
jgi:hypothetical protein